MELAVQRYGRNNLLDWPTKIQLIVAKTDAASLAYVVEALHVQMWRKSNPDPYGATELKKVVAPMSAAGRFGAANSLSSAVPGAATLMHSRRPRTAASGRLQWLRRYNHNLTTIRGPHARGPRKLLLDSEGSVRLFSPAKVLSPTSRRRFYISRKNPTPTLPYTPPEAPGP